MSGCNLSIIQYHVLLCIVLFTERHSLYLSTKHRGLYRKGDLLQAVFLGILQDGSLCSGSERKEPSVHDLWLQRSFGGSPVLSSEV